MNDTVRNRLQAHDIENRGGGWYELPGGEKVRGAETALNQVNGRQAQSSLEVDRLRFARKAGLQYDGDRDLYQVAGYKTDSELEFRDYWSRYRRQDIAGRIVDMPPQTTWRHAPRITEDGDEDTEFTQAFEQLADRDDIRLWHRLERSDRLARIGRFGLLFIGQTGTDMRLRSELEEMQGPEDVAFLSSYHEGDVDVVEWEDDPTSERFGHPTLYRIDLSSGVDAFPEAEEVVHWTRVIHIAEDPLDNEVYGRPALRRVLNRLFDLEKIVAATGEAFWQLADKILVASLDPSMNVGEDTLDKFGEALEEMYHDLRRQLVAPGMDLEWMGGDTPDPSSPADLIMMLIAAASGIPKRILFGSETGERASTQDERQWLGTIRERQTRHAEPTILRPLIDRLQEYGALPEADYDVEWPDLFELSDAQQAELNSQTASAAKSLTPAGGDPSRLVTIGESGRIRLMPMEEDDTADEAA